MQDHEVWADVRAIVDIQYRANQPKQKEDRPEQHTDDVVWFAERKGKGSG